MYQQIRKARLGELPTHQAIEDVKEGEMLVLHPKRRESNDWPRVVGGVYTIGIDLAKDKNYSVFHRLDLEAKGRRDRELRAKLNGDFPRNELSPIKKLTLRWLIVIGSVMVFLTGWKLGDMVTSSYLSSL